MPLLRAEVLQQPVLELGCDAGPDTEWLLGHGFSVVATDLAWDALQRTRRSAADALLLQHDLRTPLPFKSASFHVVVASLSLHYFDADTTTRAIAEVRRCLAPGGLLFCRVNSANDVERFFPTRDWEAVGKEERAVLRYDAPKIAWEVVLRSSA